MPNHSTISAIAIAFIVGAATSDLLAAGAETGTTSVSLTIDGSRLAIELTTDPETLLARLDRRAGHRRSKPLASESLADAIFQRPSELLRHVVVQFDDRVAQVHLDAVTAAGTETAADESSPRVTVRLSAAVPDDASSVRWTYALASAAYPLTIRQGSAVVSETIAGADPSTAVPLTDRGSPAVGRSFWVLFVPIVFGVLITLRIRERIRLRHRTARRLHEAAFDGSGVS